MCEGKFGNRWRAGGRSSDGLIGQSHCTRRGMPQVLSAIHLGNQIALELHSARIELVIIFRDGQCVEE